MRKKRSFISFLLALIITLNSGVLVNAQEMIVENSIDADLYMDSSDINSSYDVIVEPCDESDNGGLIPMDVASDDVTAGFEELMDIDLSEDVDQFDEPIDRDGGMTESYGYAGFQSGNGSRIAVYNEILDSYMLGETVSENDISEIRRYDARDYGLLTSIKNQGSYGSCWAHAAMSQAETSAIKQNMSDTSIDLSEFHLGYFSYSENNNKNGGVIPKVSYGSTKVKLSAGGNDFYAISELMNWHGIALESDYPYSLAPTRPSYEIEKSDTHNYIVSDYYLIPTKNNNKEDVKDVLKNCIYKFGSVGWSFYSTSSLYYNSVDSCGRKYTSYSTISTNKVSEKTNHAITVVGWDDDFPVENFKSESRPSKPGAWIIKNSYGVSSSSDGYFYLSYEEPTLGTGNPASVVILKNDTSEYDNNYFNSNGITNDYRVFKASATSNKFANVYKASGSKAYERVTAVSFLCNTAQNDYSIQLYKNPDVDKSGTVVNPKSGIALLKTPISGKTSYAGMTTVEIPEKIYISHGDNISVVVTLSSGSEIMYDSTYATRTDVGFVVRQPAILGKSFMQGSDGQFYDLNAGKTDGNGRYVRLNIITDDCENDEYTDGENPDSKDDKDNPADSDNPEDSDGGNEGNPSTLVEHKASTWEIVNGKKYYYNKYKKTLRGWNSIKGKDGITRKYYFNEDGSVRIGIFKDSNNKSYYLTNEIQSLSKEEYSLIKKLVRIEDLISDKTSENYNPDLYIKVINHGAMKKGEIAVGKTNNIHIFADSKGVLCSGWQKVKDNKGTKTTRDDTVTWKFYNTEEYGFTEHSDYESFVASGPGAKPKSEYPYWVTVVSMGETESEYYCFTSASKIAKGWSSVKRNFNKEKKSGKYYFDPKTGAMYRGWRTISGAQKYFGDLSGVYCADTSKNIAYSDENGRVFCLSPKGKIKTGWQKISCRYESIDQDTGLIISVKKSGKFYFEPSNRSENYGEMYVGFKKIKGKLWYFSEDDMMLTEDVDGTRGMVCTGIINLEELGVLDTTISRNGIYYCTAYNPDGTNTYYMKSSGGLGTGYRETAITVNGVKNYEKWTIYCNPVAGTGANVSPMDMPCTEVKYTSQDGKELVRKYRYGEAIGGYSDGIKGHAFAKWSEIYSEETPYYYDVENGIRKIRLK